MAVHTVLRQDAELGVLSLENGAQLARDEREYGRNSDCPLAATKREKGLVPSE